MVVTKKYIKDLREKSFLNISKEDEILILQMYGQESELDENSYLHIFTQQDIWEGIRKILRKSKSI